MKLARVQAGSRARVGVIDDESIHLFSPDVSMDDVLAGGLEHAHELAERARADAGRPLDQVQLLAPLQPASVRDFVTFEEHVEGVRRSIDGAAGVPEAWFDAPTFYFTNPHTILGPGDDVLFPAHSAARDFEMEVAAVVGQAGESLSEEKARGHIFGYTILNDWSARDLQRREMQVSLGPAKGKDFANSLGPWLVTADELDQHRDTDGFLDLWCEARINDQVVGRDLLSNMGWTFEAMLAYASRDSRVQPGDVLGSGTTGNGGCLAELWGRRGAQDPPPLQAGDVVTLTVQGLGSLTNRVATARASRAPIPPRRRSAEQARAARPHERTP